MVERTNRRKLLKSGTTFVTGFAVSDTTVAKSRKRQTEEREKEDADKNSDPSPCCGGDSHNAASGFEDEGSDNYNYWISDYRGHATVTTKLIDIIEGDDQWVYKFNTTLTSEWEAEPKFGSGWDGIGYIGGHAITIDFDDHNVTLPQQRGENNDDWLGTNHGNHGDISDYVRDDVKTAFEFGSSFVPLWSDFQSGVEFANELSAAAAKSSGGYDMKWESDASLSGWSDVNHWCKFLVLSNENKDPWEISGTVKNHIWGSVESHLESETLTHTIGGGNTADEYRNITSPSDLGLTKVTSDKKVKETQKMLDEHGIDMDDIEVWS